MARPRCAADFLDPDGTWHPCRFGVAPGSRYCGPDGRDHVDLAARARAVGVRWTGRTALLLQRRVGEGWQVRRPGDPAEDGKGWCWRAVLDALTVAGPYDTPVCGWCGCEVDEVDPALIEVRDDRAWCSACNWSTLRRREKMPSRV